MALFGFFAIVPCCGHPGPNPLAEINIRAPAVCTTTGATCRKRMEANWLRTVHDRGNLVTEPGMCERNEHPEQAKASEGSGRPEACNTSGVLGRTLSVTLEGWTIQALPAPVQRIEAALADHIRRLLPDGGGRLFVFGHRGTIEDSACSKRVIKTPRGTTQ